MASSSSSLATTAVPVQRLIFSVGTGISVASALIRNSRAPKTDIQVGDDRTMGFRGIKKEMKQKKIRGTDSDYSRVTSKKRRGNENKANRREFTEVTSHDAVRAWNRPQFQDFYVSLYYDRLMLGEPPVRTALAVANAESATFDSLCRILQQYQTLEPEDILVVVDHPGNGHDDNAAINDQERKSSLKHHLEPLSESLMMHNSNNRNRSFISDKSKSLLTEVAEAVKWRFDNSNNKSRSGNDDDEEENDENDDDDPIQYVSCLFSSGQDVDNDEIISNSKSNEKAFLSALWCSHPEEAAVAAKLMNQGAFYDKVFPDDDDENGNNQSRNQYDAFLEEELGMSTIMKQNHMNVDNEHIREIYCQGKLSRLFQFSMITQKKEKLMEAAQNPRIARAIAPGVFSNRLGGKSDVISEEIQNKKAIDEAIRREGRELLKKILE